MEGVLSIEPTPSSLPYTGKKSHGALVSKWHLFRTTSSCQKVVFAIYAVIPLKGVTRSTIRECTGDA